MNARKHENAESLYVEEIECGEPQTRQVRVANAVLRTVFHLKSGVHHAFAAQPFMSQTHSLLRSLPAVLLILAEAFEMSACCLSSGNAFSAIAIYIAFR